MNQDFINIIEEKNAEIEEKYGKSYISVSKMLDQLEHPADREKMVNNTYNKHYNNPDSQYYHMSKEEILEAWDQKAQASLHYGRMLDDYVECILEDGNMKLWKLNNNYDYDERLHMLCDGFDKFYERLMKSGDIEYLAREKKVYYMEPVTGALINGRFDAAFKNTKTGDIIIFDWKNSGTIDLSNRWQKVYGPTSYMDECNGNRYTMQLHFYKTAFAETYHIADPSKIHVFIGQFSNKVVDEENNETFKIWKENFKYDKTIIDRVASFAKQKIDVINESK